MATAIALDEETLEKAGLDFVQITIESHDSKIHDSITGEKGSWHDTLQGIKNLISTTIYTTTNTTLNKCNAKKFLETIKFLHDLGIETFGFKIVNSDNRLIFESWVFLALLIVSLFLLSQFNFP